MIDTIFLGDGNAVGFRISGRIEGSDFDRVAARIEQALGSHDQVRIYAEIESLDGMSLEVLWKDLQFSFKHIRDVEREAIVTNRDWLKNLAELGDKLFSGLEVRHFDLNQKDEARDWIQN
jgi:hypothetical protein